MQLTFLGTGSAIPIPRHIKKNDPATPLHNCPQCRSADVRDTRWPSSLLLDNHILIDASPLISLLLRSVGTKPQQITAVVLTHRHRDASGGLGSLPKGGTVLRPSRPDPFTLDGHRFEPVKVPHDRQTWGYLIDGRLAYFSDYADLRPALPALKQATVAVLDGSGWASAFPSHQPMKEVIPLVKPMTNLEHIYFTHLGHTQLPHVELERLLKKEGDDRFGLASHGLTFTF